MQTKCISVLWSCLGKVEGLQDGGEALLSLTCGFRVIIVALFPTGRKTASSSSTSGAKELLFREMIQILTFH